MPILALTQGIEIRRYSRPGRILGDYKAPVAQKKRMGKMDRLAELVVIGGIKGRKEIEDGRACPFLGLA